MKNQLWIYFVLLLINFGTSEGFQSCDPNPCFNNAVCETHPNSGDSFCRCGSGFVGEYCETRNPCVDAVCLNNATCRVITISNHQYSTECVCVPGFTGSQCEIIDPSSSCHSSPCKNGGTCVNTDAKDLSVYHCECKAGYMGMHCEKVDYCINQPCGNGATCLSHSTGYTCTCKFGFTGPDCKNDIDECAANPNLCQNGGVCENQYGSYFCNCPVTYRGQVCQEAYIPCYPDPCQNNGMCLTTSATTYQCTCPLGKCFLN